jgi:hypothetical protein
MTNEDLKQQVEDMTKVLLKKHQTPTKQQTRATYDQTTKTITSCLGESAIISTGDFKEINILDALFDFPETEYIHLSRAEYKNIWCGLLGATPERMFQTDQRETFYRGPFGLVQLIMIDRPESKLQVVNKPLLVGLT